MNDFTLDSLKLKAAIEFGSEYTYEIRNGGLGPTLYIDAETRVKAREARKKIPGSWESLYVIVIYNQRENELDILYDPNLI